MGEPASKRLENGSRVGTYTIVRELGRGGMGAVYEARHERLRKIVALKVLHQSDAEDPEARERFLREGQAASMIRHPNVVDVTDVGEHGDLTYLVMEYLPGESLEALLAREKRISPEKAAELVIPVISAVYHAHKQGVVHRDLKPANIFLSKSVHGKVIPKVVDFGISKIAERGSLGEKQPLTMTGALLGTPYFMSPEQIAGARDVGPTSDQYALGVILYRCVTGVLPFQEPNLFATLMAIGQGKFPPPREVEPSVPETLQRVILRAMETDPAKRFADLRTLGNDLLPWASAALRQEWSEAMPASTATMGDDEPPLASIPVSTDPQLQSTLRSSPVSLERAHARPAARAARPRVWLGRGVGVLAALAAALGLTRWRATPEGAAPHIVDAGVAREAPREETTRAARGSVVETPPEETARVVVDASVDAQAVPAQAVGVARVDRRRGVAHTPAVGAPSRSPRGESSPPTAPSVAGGVGVRIGVARDPNGY